MKLFGLLSLLVAAAVSVGAQETAPMKNYNVSSPVRNGPYVVGQILPCTYQLFPDIDSSVLHLNIQLQATSPGQNTSLVIATDVDVTKTPASVMHNGNVTYYEHSINYQIPKTVAPGTYNVNFIDTSTNTQLSIPIEIRAAAAPTPSASATGANGSKPSGGIFVPGNSGVATSPGLATKTLLALAAVAGVAFML
ncbi:hypothetical protein EC973_003810 [Apophysomyces ossiformis]|uniref:Uncharacterized protein n=1 Tax=Apophysomyces ossiformis TaxID=679940 RepID=A0A8H7ES37_9FUNG|nr:hypothetical protein EC973_003810 [Apophysomyces ossiformis]